MQDTLQTKAATVPSSRKTILIVENNLEWGYTLAQALKEATLYRVVFATNGFQALQIIHAVRPDVVLLASHLLSRGGLALIDHLRTSYGDGRPSIVLMSAPLSQGEIEEQQFTGNGKAFGGDILVRLVKDILE